MAALIFLGIMVGVALIGGGTAIIIALSHKNKGIEENTIEERTEMLEGFNNNEDLNLEDLEDTEDKIDEDVVKNSKKHDNKKSNNKEENNNLEMKL